MTVKLKKNERYLFKIEYVLLSSPWYDRWRKILTISFSSCCMKKISSRVRFRKSLIDIFHQIFNLYDEIFSVSFTNSQRMESKRWILSIINSVEDDMIPSKSIRWLYLLSLLECEKIRISFSIDGWLCESVDISIIMIFDSCRNTLLFSFRSSMRRIDIFQIYSVRKYWIENDNASTLNARTENKKNEASNKSNHEKHHLPYFSELILQHIKTKIWLENDAISTNP